MHGLRSHYPRAYLQVTHIDTHKSALGVIEFLFYQRNILG